MISIYNRKMDNGMTIRDEEAIKPYVQLIQWGRSHPVQFAEQILQIPLMDYQKYILTMTWKSEYAVWACSRNAGKSFLVGIYAQLRALLYSKSKIHIMSSVSRQAAETFETMENIALHNIKTLISNNTVFVDEIKKEKADSTGFTHDAKKGSQVRLINGSYVASVTGTAKTIRGKRSNVNIYDEAGFIANDFFDITEPFISQGADFKMGSTYDPEVYPQEVPNTRVYVGSASDTNSAFYRKYCEGLKQMLMGNSKYFVVDLNCEIPMKHTTMNGKKIKPLLSQDEIDRKMRENEILARREYYNIFDRFDLEASVVSRSDILANTRDYLPVLHYDGHKTSYVLCYDPASRSDNSPVLVGEVFKDRDGRWCGRVVNMINLVATYNDGSKKPMRLDEQAQMLREMIYDYNGKSEFAPYVNVTVLLD